MKISSMISKEYPYAIHTIRITSDRQVGDLGIHISLCGIENPRRLFLITSFLLLFFTTCLGIGGAEIRATGLMRRVYWPPLLTEFGGVQMSTFSFSKPLKIKFETTNDGQHMVTLFEGSNPPRRPHGCHLYAFDSVGNSLPDSATWLKRLGQKRRTRYVYLAPAHSISETFILSGRFKFAIPGVFYFYAIRSVTIGKYKGGNPAGFAQGTLISPILRLTLLKGHNPTWNVVRSIPKPKIPVASSTLTITPTFPKYKIPTTGPLVTLVEIAKAVHAHVLNHVQLRCYYDGHGAEPFYLALAKDCMAMSAYCDAIKKRFGVDLRACLRSS